MLSDKDQSADETPRATAPLKPAKLGAGRLPLLVENGLVGALLRRGAPAADSNIPSQMPRSLPREQR